MKHSVIVADRDKVLTDIRFDEVGMLLTKVWALAAVLNQASETERGYLNSHTVMTATTDMMENLDKIKDMLRS